MDPERASGQRAQSQVGERDAEQIITQGKDDGSCRKRSGRESRALSVWNWDTLGGLAKLPKIVTLALPAEG